MPGGLTAQGINVGIDDDDDDDDVATACVCAGTGDVSSIATSFNV